MAEVMSAMTPVAAANPHSWSPHTLSVADIETPGPHNRYVGWPYTKAEVSVMDVDMAAALLVTTEAKADALGIPADRRAYLNSSCYAEDPAGIAERADLGASAAMAVTGDAALRGAGLELDDLRHVDLYSCFPSAINLACDALGLAADDWRGYTVTGGLPFHGGPGSGYMLHSIAMSVEMLREQGGAAMVTGIGMHMHKHVAAIYSMSPGLQLPGDVQAEVDGRQARRPLVDCYDGPATVAAYTVAHDREGPQVGLVVLDIPNGRTLARFREPDLLADAEQRELVGQKVRVATNGTTNTATW